MRRKAVRLIKKLLEYRGVWRHCSRRLCAVLAGAPFLMGMLLLLCGNGEVRSVRTYAKLEPESISCVEKVALMPGQDSPVQLEAEEAGKLLEGDDYREPLLKLLEKYPLTAEIIVNRDAYPDWLIEYLAGHPEAIEWAAAYPAQMEKGQEVLNEEAVQQVDLESYPEQEGYPLYYQWDLDWGYASYGTGLIATGGCGPTCLAIVAAGLTKDGSFTPKRVADFAVEEGYFVPESGTLWSLMLEGARGLGLASRQMENWSVSALEEELEAGHPIICSMNPGDFTETGHFIVLVAGTEDGMIVVNDPNSRSNSLRRWDAQIILDQTKGMWVYSREEEGP